MVLVELAANLPENTPTYKEYHVSTHESFYKKDYAAAMFLTAASKLTNPICWCSSYAHRILAPFLPGEYGFKPTAVEEGALRSFYFLKFCLLTPVSVPLGGAGIGCRCIASSLLTDNFCYLPGRAKSLNSLKNNTLTVITWNVCGIGGSMELSHGGVRDWNERVEEIAQEIKHQNADIICLQEVHDTCFGDSLYTRLKNDYAHFYMHLGPNPLGSNSGNYIASKYPLEDFTFTEFDASLGSGKWQKKGFANFNVFAEGKPIIHIIATHFQYGQMIEGEGKIIAVRKKQLSQIMDSCNYCYSKNLPVLLLGDLNIEFGSKEFQNSVLASHFKHGYSYENPTSTCNLIQCVWDSGKHTDGKVDEKIDYISFLDKNPRTGKKLSHPKLEVKLVEAYEKEDPLTAKSDHHALVGRITFN